MWKDLSLKDKAELIKLAVNNGITDLSTIRDTYNKFEEGGSLDDSDTSKVKVSSNAIPSELPEAVVTGYAPLRLTTHYPIISEKYPYTGHSELAVPIDPETFYGEYNPGNFNSMHYLHIDKKSSDRDYNILTNNCADATLNFLNNAFNKNETPNLFTTPGDVRDLAIKLGGRVVKNNDGSDTVLIPRNKDNYKDISQKAFDLLYTNMNSFKLSGNHSYSEGGPIKKVGPTYDPERKMWIGPNGQNITGKSFEGDWGITTYLDSGAVELDTREEDDPENRYKYRYADNAKRVYIGGTSNEARQEYFNRDKELTEAVKTSSKKHGISANLLASRIAREGPIDEAIKNYNNTNGYFQRGRLVGPLWGLDDMGTMIFDGTVKIDPEMVVNTDHEYQNEKGRTTYSVNSDNYLDGVELTAVALKYYKDEMKKRYPKASDEALEQYANAAFNMGISGATKAINEGRIVNAYKPFINIKANGGNLYSKINKFEDGGDTLEDAVINTLTGFIPIYGTYQDAKDFYNEPSWENAGWVGLSVLSEFPILKALKGIKAASKITKATKKLEQAKNTLDNARRQESRAIRQGLNRSARSARTTAREAAEKQVKQMQKEYNLLQKQIDNALPNSKTPLYFAPNVLTEGFQNGLQPDYSPYHRVD